jgi:hypothetical protein
MSSSFFLVFNTQAKEGKVKKFIEAPHEGGRNVYDAAI